MINELNLTPKQYLITFLVLLLLSLIVRHIHSDVEIELPNDDAEPQPKLSPLYGAYLQSQSKYYN